jgi:hypothetical protein
MLHQLFVHRLNLSIHVQLSPPLVDPAVGEKKERSTSRYCLHSQYLSLSSAHSTQMKSNYGEVMGVQAWDDVQ